MFDLKTRKRDFEQQLFFLLEKSQTSLQIPRDRTKKSCATARPTSSESNVAFFVFRDRSDDAFGTISDNRYLFFHHHRSTPRNRRTSTFFFFSLKTRSIQKRKEEKRSVRAQKEKGGLCLPRSFRRRRRNDLSAEKVNLFSSSSLDFENAPSFHAALPREKRKTRHTKRKEKTRTPKNTPPFLKMSQHVATKKRWKNFSSALPLFTLKPETGVSRTSLFAVLPLAPKRVTLLPSLVSWSERGKRHARNCF